MNLRLINPEEHQRRFMELSRLHELEIDNEKKVEYAMEILKKGGQRYNVNPPKKKTLLLKEGNCYFNAIRKMEQGFEYVEGVIIGRENGLKISHAWNVDSNGNHLDFTNVNNAGYDYLGLVIPSSLLYKIGALNGHIWYCSLPYLTVE